MALGQLEQNPGYLEQNPWYLDTTRLEKLGFFQHSRLESGSQPEDITNFYAYIERLRAGDVPFELVSVYPETNTCALYVKQPGKLVCQTLSG